MATIKKLSPVKEIQNNVCLIKPNFLFRHNIVKYHFASGSTLDIICEVAKKE